MDLLAFELSTERCSVALLEDGNMHQRAETGNRPSRRILAMADELLACAGRHLAELDAIAFGCGPGAFTGLRIAAGVAQGLAFGADIPVVPVSSLAALAQRAFEAHGCERVIPLLDARMNEIYAGAYRKGLNGLVQPIRDDALLPPAQLDIPEGEWSGAGPGWRAYPALADRVGGILPDVYPDAAAVARLGTVIFANEGGLPAEEAVPVYLRDTVAWQKVR